VSDSVFLYQREKERRGEGERERELLSLKESSSIGEKLP
jgi:hypothetical protein